MYIYNVLECIYIILMQYVYKCCTNFSPNSKISINNICKVMTLANVMIAMKTRGRTLFCNILIVYIIIIFVQLNLIIIKSNLTLKISI